MIFVFGPSKNLLNAIEAALVDSDIDINHYYTLEKLIEDYHVDKVKTVIMQSGPSFSVTVRYIQYLRYYLVMAPLVVIAERPSIQEAVNLIKLGINDYLDFPTTSSRIIDAVTQSVQIFEEMSHELKTYRHFIKNYLLLTDHEKQVMHKVCQGMSSKKIATKLCCAFRTIELHRTKLLKKFNLNSSIQLACMLMKCTFMARRLGITDLIGESHLPQVNELHNNDWDRSLD